MTHYKYIVTYIFLISSCNLQADCMARAGRFDATPVFKILECRHASAVIEEFRLKNPDWSGNIQFRDNDSAVKVTFINEDARRFLWSTAEYWYYPNGCSSIEVGQILGNPQIDELCCDLGPVRNVHCGLGGTKLVLENRKREPRSGIDAP